MRIGFHNLYGWGLMRIAFTPVRAGLIENLEDSQ